MLGERALDEDLLESIDLFAQRDFLDSWARQGADGIIE
jgi:hypothetical protein